MGSLVSMHVPIGGEGLAAELTRERPLSRMHQHVPVEGAERRQHLTAQAAVVNLGLTGGVTGIRVRLDLIVTPDVCGEIFLRGEVIFAERAAVDVAAVAVDHSRRGDYRHRDGTWWDDGLQGYVGICWCHWLRWSLW